MSSACIVTLNVRQNPGVLPGLSCAAPSVSACGFDATGQRKESAPQSAARKTVPRLFAPRFPFLRSPKGPMKRGSFRSVAPRRLCDASAIWVVALATCHLRATTYQPEAEKTGHSPLPEVPDQSCAGELSGLARFSTISRRTRWASICSRVSHAGRIFF